MLSWIGRFLIALGILFAALYLGKGLLLLFPLGISESILGLLILFSLLSLKIVRLEWVLPATQPILRYMALFFLPICAGIIDQTELLIQHFNSLLVATVLSTIVTLLVISKLAQYLLKDDTHG